MAPTDANHEAAPAEYERLFHAEKTMVVARWIAAVFALAQVLTFYRPYPGYILPVALCIVGAICAGNVALSYALRRHPTPKQLRQISLASLTFDLFIAQALIWTYTFDPETAIWAVLYLLPLGGAIRFQWRGAIWVTVAGSIGYSIREVFGNAAYDNEFLLSSITFRCGIAFLIAFVAGRATQELLDGRRAVELANRELSDVNLTMREFVSIASHDMRTPVSVISGLSNTMARNGASMSESQKQELLEVIYRRAQSLDRLVNDLLATSNIDAGILPCRPEPIDTYDLINDIQQIPDAPKAELHVDPHVKAYADPEHVRRIMGNLLSNAARYGKGPIAVYVRAASPSVEITVEDSGEGVPPSFVPRLFEKFARAPETARSIEGTGLGLTIVKGLAEQNGGYVSYKQNNHGGAAFSVTLPQWTESVAST